MPWIEIALMVVSVLLLLAGGYIKRLSSELKDVFVVLGSALEDNKISKEELAQIFKECKDVKDAAAELAQIIVSRRIK